MHSKNKCLNGSDGASLLRNKKIYCFFDQRSDLEQQCKHTQSGHRREVFHKSSRSESCHQFLFMSLFEESSLRYQLKGVTLWHYQCKVCSKVSLFVMPDQHQVWEKIKMVTNQVKSVSKKIQSNLFDFHFFKYKFQLLRALFSFVDFCNQPFRVQFPTNPLVQILILQCS